MKYSILLAVQCYSNEVSGKGGHCHEPVKISCMRALGRACCSALHKILTIKKSSIKSKAPNAISSIKIKKHRMDIENSKN